MRSSESPFLADWFAVSMRWLSIVGFTMLLAYTSQLGFEQLLALGGITLWNLIITVLAASNRRMPGHRVWNILVDFCFSLLLFFLTGLLSGPLVGSSLLVLLSSAIYYPLLINLYVSILISVGQIGLILFLTPGSLQPLLLILLVGFNILAGLLLGVIGNRLFSRLRMNYFEQVTRRNDRDRLTQREERARLKAIYQMTEKLSSILGYQDVLESTLDISANSLGASAQSSFQLVSAILLFDHTGHLRIGSARHLPSADLRHTFPAEEGALQTAIKNPDLLKLSKPGEDKELSALSGLHSCQEALILPLRRGLNAYGVLLFAHPTVDFFTPDRCELLMVIAQQAGIAIQNARMFQQINEEKEHIITIQDETRKKLARDLHDGPTQSVSTIAMQANIAQKIVESDPGKAREELLRIEELARRTSQEMRNMLFTLRPLVLENEGLQAALQTMAEKMQEIFQQKMVIQLDQTIVNKFDLTQQTTLFQIAEEAVNNARKHAQANLIGIRLHTLPADNEVAILEIADNGVGFDLQSVSGNYDRRGSLGMKNLQERTNLINGILHIDTAPGKGTCVKIFIPLSDSAYSRLNNNQIPLK